MIIDLSIRSLLGAAVLLFLQVRILTMRQELSFNKKLLVVKAGLGTHTDVSEARDPHTLTRYLQVTCSYRNPAWY